MRGRPNDIIKAREMRTKHAKRPHTCKFCGNVFYGNGGYAAHMRKEYFQRMPEMKIKKRFLQGVLSWKSVVWFIVLLMRQNTFVSNPLARFVEQRSKCAKIFM